MECRWRAAKIINFILKFYVCLAKENMETWLRGAKKTQFDLLRAGHGVLFWREVVF